MQKNYFSSEIGDFFFYSHETAFREMVLCPRNLVGTSEPAKEEADELKGKVTQINFEIK